MVITAWWQPGAPDHVIARVTCTVSNDSAARTHLTATGVDDITDIVRAWLSSLTTQP
jgi:hypothetical protein